jgi:hypothetical protein
LRTFRVLAFALLVPVGALVRVEAAMRELFAANQARQGAPDRTWFKMRDGSLRQK